MEALFFHTSLVPLLILAAIIGGIVALVRHGRGAPSEPGIGTLRRLFIYGLGFIALMLSAGGVNALLNSLLDTLATASLLHGTERALALGLSAIIVGVPVWIVLWNAARRSVRQYPAESGTLARKLYAYGVLTVAAGATAVSAVALLRELFSPSDFDPSPIAGVLAWGGVWLFHWRAESVEGQPTEVARAIRRLYIYSATIYGLAMLTIGAGLVVSGLLLAAYDRIFGSALVVPSSGLWTSGLRGALAAALVGGLWWWWHWHRAARGDAQSTLRQVFLHAFAIFGGLALVVGSVSTMLFFTVRWFLARPEGASAVAEFDVLPAAAVWAAAGAAVWGYHSAIAHQEAPASGDLRLQAHRVYRYQTAAVGLATLAVGLAMMIGVGIGVLVPSAQPHLVDQRWWADPLTTALTLMAVGAALWGYHWAKQQGLVAAVGRSERDALSRRVFIFTVLGAALLATLGSLTAIIFSVILDALEGELSTRVLDAGKWELGVLLMAGTIAGYHWLVLREDRALLAPEAPPAAPVTAPPEAPSERSVTPSEPKQVIVLADDAGAALGQAIADRLSYGVVSWQRRDDAGTPGPLPAAELDAIAARIASAPGEQLLLVIDASGVHVVPYTADQP